MCSNIPLAYIYDMYKLYTNQKIIETILQTVKIKHKILKMSNFFLENDMTIFLNVPKIIDPKLWLEKPFTTIICFKHKTDVEDEALEIFIKSPERIGKYYAIGQCDIVMISTTDPNDSFELYADTINILKKSSIFCNDPFIYVLNKCS